jgi:long-subunit fatty acid transport protein
VSLFNGTEFVHTKLPRTNLTTQVELPVTYTGDLSYHRDVWSAYTEYSNGLGGTNFRAGLEYRLSRVELRGAGRYSQDHWYPAAGAGYNFTRTFGIDAALYGTHTFLEPDPHVGLAISLRFERR